jgi:pSer/pThr/pTyr-binding forkhead associated (FHA) protein
MAAGVGAPIAPAASNVPEPRTSPPPPDRRSGGFAAVPRPSTPQDARPIRIARLTGTLGTFTLEHGTYTVGRSEKAEIRLDDREVSRAHAIVIVSATSVSVEDQKSANGTFVNGVEVTARRALSQGDKVMFGGLEFTVDIVHEGSS